MERFWLFLVPLVILAIAEARWPRRSRILTRRERWPSAAMLLFVGLVLGRLMVPAGLAGIALWADSQNIGLFNLLDTPFWATALIGYIAFDLSVWAQHVALHRIDLLWRLHRVHHADPDFDVFTALRFHPGELLLSLLWKGLVILILGIPALLAVWFEVVLNVGAMFNHSNLKLPLWLDRWLRLLFVTPDMHRVHHSTDHMEANRNFGFFIPWWDRLFGTYKAQPDQGHSGLEIGQKNWREAEDQSFISLLTQPKLKP